MQQHSRTLRHDFRTHWLLLDYDLTALLAAKGAEGSEKGYFSGHRNRYGRQLVRISAPGYHETLISLLYLGSCLGFTTLKSGMQALERQLPMERWQRQRTIIRSDAGLGTGENVNWLLWRGYQVLTKGFSHTRAAVRARLITDPEAWIRDPDRERWIARSVAPRDLDGGRISTCCAGQQMMASAMAH